MKACWGSVSALLRFYAALLKLNFKAALALRAAFVLQVAFMALNNLVFFSFWWFLLARVPSIGGWRLPDIALLYGIVAAGFGLAVTLAGGVRELARCIDEGELDTLLTQPKPVLLYALGSRSQVSGVGDVLSGVVLLGCSGAVGIADAPRALLAIVACASMFVATGTLIYSSAFWLGQSETLARQAFDVLITFSLYPEPLFGGVLRLLLFTLLPAGFVGYVPAELVRQPSLSALVATIAAPAAYSALAIWMFGRGLKHYSSGSRFTILGN